MTDKEVMQKVFARIQAQNNAANTQLRNYIDVDSGAYQRWRGRKDAYESLLSYIEVYAKEAGCQVHHDAKSGKCKITWEDAE